MSETIYRVKLVEILAFVFLIFATSEVRAEDIDLGNKFTNEFTVKIPTKGPILDRRVAKSTPEQIAKLTKGTVFEVVKKKRSYSHATFAKKLPLELIPFSIRNDSYDSIGTAFALADGTLITAAHVMEAGLLNPEEELFIRDQSKKIFEIDKIVGYSNKKDFTVFTVKNPTFVDSLKTNLKPSLNTKVFTVGNALGQGVVIREGLFTSMTHEDENGEWQWLRFSAPASPGNSGGPLLDGQGRVIGVVVMKTANENLNYALPLSEVYKSGTKEARFSRKMLYQLSNTTRTTLLPLETKYSLPKSYSEFKKVLYTDYSKYLTDLMVEFKKEHQNELFPKGPGSEAIIQANGDWNSFPHQLYEDQGKWVNQPTENIKHFEIDPDTDLFLYTGSGFSEMMVSSKDPKASLNYSTDSKAYLDTILRAVPLSVQIGNTTTRITSLSKAASEEIFVDRYQRKWIIRAWDYPLTENKVLTMSLPTPNGIFSRVSLIPSGTQVDHVVAFKYYADFYFFSFYGTLSHWLNFQALPKEIRSETPLLASISVDPAKFQVKNSHFEFSLDGNDLVSIPDSQIHVKSGLSMGPNGSTQIDIFGVGISFSPKERITFNRYTKPNMDFIMNFPRDPKVEKTNFGTSVYLTLTEKYLKMDKSEKEKVSQYFEVVRELPGDKSAGELKDAIKPYEKKLKILED